MIDYDDYKDFIIYQDGLIGSITLDDFIKEFEKCIKEQQNFENIIYDILKNQNFDDETLASLFTLSKTDSMKFNINLLKNEL